MVMNWVVVIGLGLIFTLTIGVSATGFQLDTESDTSLDITPAFLLIAIGSMALWLFLATWTFKDARTRGRKGGFWFVMVMLFNIFGIILYLMTQKRRPLYMEMITDAIPLAIPVNVKYREEPNVNIKHSYHSEEVSGYATRRNVQERDRESPHF